MDTLQNNTATGLPLNVDVNPAYEKYRATPETNRLIDYLRTIPLGNIVSFEEMDAAVPGMDFREAHRGRLATATKNLWKDHGIYFRAIRGIGIQRCNHDEATMHISDHHGTRHRNNMRRYERKIDHVDASKLATTEAKQQFMLSQFQIALNKSINDAKVQKQLKVHAASNNEALVQTLSSSKDMINALLSAGITG